MKPIIIILSILTLSANYSMAAAGSIHNKHNKMHLDKKLRKIIQANSLTGNPLTNRTVPSIDSPLAQLGMELFYSTSLGGDRDSACVTCHHPVLGGGDNLSLPIGVGAEIIDQLGEGRTHVGGVPPVPRNAPSTFNVVVWDSVMFHDGRVESQDKVPGKNGAESPIRTPDTKFEEADTNAGENLVQAQARFPVTSPEEMKGFNHGSYTNQPIRDYLAERLGGFTEDEWNLHEADIKLWLTKFQDAFASTEEADKLITEQNISLAIGEYERSQAFVNTPWKKYIKGDKQAISASAKKGALLFYKTVEEGGADCARCHSGDFFTDESFHNLAMPQIGPGKGDGSDGSEDFGRYRETEKASDKYAFRTPTLLNVEVTGPWSHAGAYTTLEAVVRHHLDTDTAIAEYDYESQVEYQPGVQNLSLTADNTQKARDENNFAFDQPIDLTDMQVNNLLNFLKSLTDPCTTDRTCLAKWIPDHEDPDANDDQLNAIDIYGDLL